MDSPWPQMFVFGEVQDPTTETVNLVEDIVRGQIIELVRGPLHPLSPLATPIHRPSADPPLRNTRRLFKRVTWPADAGHGTSPLRTSYSSSDTTVRK